MLPHPEGPITPFERQLALEPALHEFEKILNTDGLAILQMYDQIHTAPLRGGNLSWIQRDLDDTRGIHFDVARRGLSRRPVKFIDDRSQHTHSSTKLNTSHTALFRPRHLS